MIRQRARQQISQISLTGKSPASRRDEGVERLAVLFREFMTTEEARRVPKISTGADYSVMGGKYLFMNGL